MAGQGKYFPDHLQTKEDADDSENPNDGKAENEEGSGIKVNGKKAHTWKCFYLSGQKYNQSKNTRINLKFKIYVHIKYLFNM